MNKHQGVSNIFNVKTHSVLCWITSLKWDGVKVYEINASIALHMSLQKLHNQVQRTIDSFLIDRVRQIGSREKAVVHVREHNRFRSGEARLNRAKPFAALMIILRITYNFMYTMEA